MTGEVRRNFKEKEDIIKSDKNELIPYRSDRYKAGKDDVEINGDLPAKT